MVHILKSHYYLVCLSLITVLACWLRFWNIGDIEQLVFDEVYFANNAHDYLNNTFFFDSHPPLSKYLIAIGIWLHNAMPWVNDAHYLQADIEQLSASARRWFNAATGTLLCVIAARLSLRLHPSKLISLAIALFLAIDGTFIVESRFAFNNIYIVFLGCCACLMLAKALQETTKMKRYLALCGVFLGLTYSVKWNGLGFSLAAWIILFAPMMMIFLAHLIAKTHQNEQLELQRYHPIFSLKLLLPSIVFLFILPVAVYSIVWIPHIQMFDEYSFVEMQKQIFGYHANNVSANEHPYCSTWNSWPIQLRPISYYFAASGSGASRTFTDIHLLGNPFLFWISCVTLCITLGYWLKNLYCWLKVSIVSSDLKIQSFIIVGFLANWLPWMIVERCLFQYHYMPASFFAFLSVAWVLHKLIDTRLIITRAVAAIIGLAILFGLVFWLPIYLGIPLSPEGFYDRMWLKSWI